MDNSSKNWSYVGKKVFVGVDVHKRTYSVVTVMEGEVVKKWRTSAHPQKLADQLNKYFAGASIESVYEAGFSGFVLHRELEKAGINNIVVNAGSIEVAVHNRVKTDKRDALKLATLHESGRLIGIRIPTQKEEQRRLLTRTRQQLVEDRTAIKNQIRMKSHQMGLIEPEDRREMSHRLVEELLCQSPSAEFSLVVQAYWQVWKTIEAQIKKIEEKLKEQAQKDPNETIYRSAPGIGALGARILSNELGNLSQFDNERQLFSYTGLTPSEHSSGENIRKGHITHQGNSRVRHILKSCMEQVQEREALGWSKGGFSTKIHLRCDGNGLPITFLVSVGERHETVLFEPLICKALSKDQDQDDLGLDQGESVVIKAIAVGKSGVICADGEFARQFREKLMSIEEVSLTKPYTVNGN